MGLVVKIHKQKTNAESFPITKNEGGLPLPPRWEESLGWKKKGGKLEMKYTVFIAVNNSNTNNTKSIPIKDHNLYIYCIYRVKSGAVDEAQDYRLSID